jgi:hypothetical protein
VRPSVVKSMDLLSPSVLFCRVVEPKAHTY